MSFGFGYTEVIGSICPRSFKYISGWRYSISIGVGRNENQEKETVIVYDFLKMFLQAWKRERVVSRQEVG